MSRVLVLRTCLVRAGVRESCQLASHFSARSSPGRARGACVGRVPPTRTGTRVYLLLTGCLGPGLREMARSHDRRHGVSALGSSVRHAPLGGRGRGGGVGEFFAFAVVRSSLSSAVGVNVLGHGRERRARKRPLLALCATIRWPMDGEGWGDTGQ